MEKIARYKPGENVTVFAEEQIPAGRFVMISGDKTSQGDYKAKLATANLERPFGVSERDSGPTGDPSTSWTRRINVCRRGCIAKVKAAAGITAGEEVYISGSGEVKKLAAEKLAVGRAMNTVTEGQYVEVDVY